MRKMLNSPEYGLSSVDNVQESILWGSMSFINLFHSHCCIGDSGVVVEEEDDCLVRCGARDLHSNLLKELRQGNVAWRKKPGKEIGDKKSHHISHEMIVAMEKKMKMWCRS
eukprot:TRINITY_DN597_c0_g2_i1.p1 TRINITY_DN597_c0_g2~~TRINITY_DN597_c0_g2_i1.p1  ORF type:complete len:111 (+),score=0.69 TRINITY_DN597_c0_g2_i1:684-1016(+)